MSFFRRLEDYNDNLAVIDHEDRHYTYRELAGLCDDFSDTIAGSEKKLVLILCENRIETIIAYLSSLRSGNVVMLADAGNDRALITKLIGIYEPDFIWKPAEASSEAIYRYGRYMLVRREVAADAPVHRSLSLLLSTSGTTGSPKLVRLSQDNIASNAAAISEYLKLDEKQRPITVLPMHYSYGLSVVNSHLGAGATILLTDSSIMSRSFWDFFKGQGATSFAGVPYTYEILKKLRFFNMTLPSLSVMTQAGGRLAPEMVLEFAEFSLGKGIDFFVMYGQTEATARISYLPPEKIMDKYRSIGVAIPGGNLTLIDKDGFDIILPFKEGELVYRGKNVMMGYACSREDLARGDELRGVLRTGDIAYFDEEGYFYITGREKRFIKIFGNRVNLEDVEAFLREEGIDCACGGDDDLLCVAHRRTEGTEDIRKLVAHKFGLHYSVVKVTEVNEIERSSSGKIRYDRVF